jgi:hypothetical protein
MLLTPAHMTRRLAQVCRICANMHSVCLVQEAPREAQVVFNPQSTLTVVGLKDYEYEF